MPRSVLTMSSRAARSGLVAVVTGVVLAAGLAAPAAAAVPTAPTGVWGIGYEGAVRLTWVGPDDDGGAAITSYLVTDDLGGSWTLDPETIYPTVIEGLPNGVARRFTVTAVNADGAGPASAPSAPITPHAPYAGPAWTATGSLPAAREHAGAVLLGTGQVLVVGGVRFDPTTWTSHPLATALLYDPATGRWTRTGSLPAARAQFGLVTLADGRVQLSGGIDASGTPTATTYLYDPATGAWSTGTPMTLPRAHHSATVLPNRQVLVAGGETTGPAVTATAETYAPATGIWRATRPMPTPRHRHSAVALPAGSAGQVILVGGNDGTDGLRPTALYEQATRSWVVGPSLQRQRTTEDVGDPTVTALADGRVLVAGGYHGGVLRSAEVYTPSTNTFALTRPLRFALEGDHTATLLTDGRVLVVGGIDDWGGLRTTQIWSPVTGRWTRGNDLPGDRASHVAVRTGSGAVLVAGGMRWTPAYGSVRTALLYQP